MTVTLCPARGGAQGLILPVPGSPDALWFGRCLALAAGGEAGEVGGAPYWRADLGCGDAGHGVGEGGEVEVCQVVHDVLAYGGQEGRVGLLQAGESGGGEDGQLAAAVCVGFDALGQSLAGEPLDDAG